MSAFETASSWIDDHFAEPMARLSEQRHLRAIRDGIISCLPIIIVSSFLMVIAFAYNYMPSDWALAQFLQANAVKILLPYRMSMYILSLYACFGIGYSLARSYDVDGLMGGLLSVMALLLTIVPVMMPDMTDAVLAALNGNDALTEAGVAATMQAVDGAYVMNMGYLGTGQVFVSIICAFVAVEVYRLCLQHNVTIKMPPQVPAAVSNSFAALIPTAIVLVLFSAVCLWGGFDIHGFISTLIAPLVSGTDTLGAALVVVFLEMLFWCFGIHGTSIVYSIARPLWLVLLDENAAAYAAGAAVPHIVVEPFFQWFVQIGGSGCTLSLAILLLFFSKSKYGKAMGKATIVPAVFNINEPLMFGVPLVLSPTFFIPLVVVPLLNTLISYFCMAVGLVGRFVGAIVPWVLPGPIGAYLACGGDWRAAVLNVVLIALGMLVYFPFFRAWEKQMLKAEADEGADPETAEV
ncbi:PTS sugar transporter subunit IIC [Olsenella sp. YH-ols2217]|uniref:Permease IIC component n=1 Tax=Kribbibacterium absianum TaxID=3044210 RepID=A0ABT6ZK94_9ACTN|nr:MULTISPECIES: PTS sugar transporter subunit IIC [unclassified Olsenella]MDJ1122434.1 PTS sugar transporter subunit IIC [Olsenella sp. YH-ols2216]MDJ1129312.1 PTS sugar transporter subunit IIC [Olsenella sp. YH-ols2217]